MTNFGIIGVNHQQTDISVREQLTIKKNEIKPLFDFLKKNIQCCDLLFLSTCNRLEIYYTAEIDCSEKLFQYFLQFKAIANQKIAYYQYLNEQALRHLWAVASGLDSLVLGETQVLGQLKESQKLMAELYNHSTMFTRIIESAYQIAKKIRNKTAITKDSVSIGKIAVLLAVQILGELHERSILMIGAGDVAENSLVYLKKFGFKKLTICNRTVQKAAQIADKYKAGVVPISELADALLDVDVVISSIDIDEPILLTNQLIEIMKKRRYRPLLIIDLGLPRNIQASVKKIDNCYLYNIDNLQEVAQKNRQLKSIEVGQAWQIIEQSLPLFKNWQKMFLERANISQFRDLFFQKYFAELCIYINQQVLTEEQKKNITRKIHLVANKILHAPMQSINNSEMPSTVLNQLQQLFYLQFEEPAPKAKIVNIKHGQKKA